MTEGGVAPRLLKLSWPLVAGNLLQTVYNVADMFWVGRVNAEAVAAVSLMFPTAYLFVSVGLGVNAAAVALISQHVGADEERAAENAVAQAMLLALAAAVLLALVGFAGRHQLLTAIGARGAVYGYALDYIEVIFLTIPFTFLFFVFRASLRAAGDTKTAMWLVVISAGLNVAIDPLFILGYDPLGIPAMGTRGAGLATLVARFVAAASGLYVLLNGGWGIRLRVGDLRPDRAVLRKLFDVGYPATADGLTRSLAAVAVAALVARFGPIATAAYGIVLRLMSVTWTVSGAVGQAAATGVGQNLGADQSSRAARVAWVGTAGAMVVLAGFSVLVLAAPAFAIRVFSPDPGVIAEGVNMLWIVAPFWTFFGGLMVVQGAFRGAGSTRAAFVLSLLSRWVFRIPVAVVLAYPLAWGADGIWWSFSVSGVLAFVVGVVWFRMGTWTERVVEGEGAAVDAEEAGEPTGTDVDD